MSKRRTNNKTTVTLRGEVHIDTSVSPEHLQMIEDIKQYIKEMQLGIEYDDADIYAALKKEHFQLDIALASLMECMFVVGM